MGNYIVGEICEAETGNGSWVECEILHIGNPFGLMSAFQDDYTVEAPGCLNPGRGDCIWVAQESLLRKKRPPQSDEAEDEAAQKFIDNLNTMLESNQKLEVEV